MEYHVRPLATNPGISESEPGNSNSTHPAEPFVVFSWVFTLSIALGVVYVFRLQGAQRMD